MADNLAKLGALSTEPLSLDYCKPMPEDIIHLHHNACLKSAIEELEESFTHKGIRRFCDEILQGPWFEDVRGVNRSVITFMARLRSHHVATGLHLMDKNIIDDATCECGWSNRDLEHILFRCPIFAKESDSLLLRLFYTDGTSATGNL
ncbi:uncharacterized protein LOC112588365 [Harpegnathos saltator]|uniref:uncharacterized protein LOC112588365 n=1 Tax=Harpegnathos saltator TaxID=610380 RepID=UPI000DBECEF6|nr:uncharacterized protein LOC112588365 [Harpegnathos saltator]